MQGNAPGPSMRATRSQKTGENPGNKAKLIQNCPILTPTKEEFVNFLPYMEKVEEQYSREFGMVKVKNPLSF